ncbi:MAG: hypothetical protein ACI86H_002987 [bacterium]|jgi:hypothetical protein
MDFRRYKYPRTPHLPWSPSFTSDDLHNKNLSNFEGKEVVVTEKMDGENTSMYFDYIHARSIDGRHHPSRDWVKQLHGMIAHQIPKGWRICGENVYAKYSVSYKNLKSYFYLFSIWDESNQCLSWKDTIEWADLLGLEIPTIFYQGIWNQKKIKSIQVNSQDCEGYVVRVAYSFLYQDFQNSTAKWVRPNHVQTDKHWMHSEITPNQLIEKV